MVLRLTIYSSQSPWWYSDYSYTRHSLLGGSQAIPMHITVSLVALRLFLYSSQFPWLYTDYLYTHHSLPGGTHSIPLLITISLGETQTTPILITVPLVVLRPSICSSQSALWYSDYPYTHHSLPGGSLPYPFIHHSLPCLLGPSLYTSQSTWWYSNYPYKYHGLPYGIQTIPLDITASLIAHRHFT